LLIVADGGDSNAVGGSGDFAAKVAGWSAGSATGFIELRLDIFAISLCEFGVGPEFVENRG
jgi:hypothetical protein